MKRFIKKITAVALAMVMLVSVVAIGFTGKIAKAADIMESSLMKLDGVQPSGFSTTTNPYGYGVGMPFLLSEQNEIMFFRSYNQHDGGMKRISYFNGESRDDLKNFTNKHSTGVTDGYYPMPDYATWSMVQAVAFDPNNTGRKDHVAFIGMGFREKTGDENKHFKRACTWVVDVENNKLVDHEWLGYMDWVDDSYDYHQANSFFSIAAGDFDGDGKESIVAYAALTTYNDGSGKGCTIFELEYDSNKDSDKYSIVNETEALFNSHYIRREKSLFRDNVGTDGKNVNTDKSCKNKMYANIAVGDFNADGYDDLAVQSYVNKLDVDNINLGMYAQPVKIIYGRDNGMPVTKNSIDFDFDLRKTPDNSDRTYFPIGSSLTAGDIDGDGDCDLVVAGSEGYYEVKEGNVDGKISINDERTHMATILGISKTQMELYYNDAIDANEWTSDGTYDDPCPSPYGLETVAINGKGDKEFVFVNGKLIDFSKGSPEEVYELEYFSDSDNGADNMIINNTFISSVISGNFDGNAAGREQIVFVVGLKQEGSDDYAFVMGYIGGDKYDDQKNSDGSIKSYGVAKDYTGTDINSDECDYIFEGKGDDLEEGLNCFIVAVDRDDDGVLARYRGVEYAYTDPEVKAVLQAAPYFSEIQDCGNNETEYVLETEYELTQSSSDNVSYSMGLTTDVDLKVFAMSIEAGYCMDWSKTYEETMTETYSTSFSATAYDTVVVNRIPVFIYVYDIQKSNGKWPGEEEPPQESTTGGLGSLPGYNDTELNDSVTGGVDTLPERDETSEMRVTIPQEPVYESLSVSDYNEFVDAYNTMMSETDVELWYELHKIDEKKHWLYNNEGNPYAYNQHGWGFEGAKQISKAPFALGKNNALNKVSWNETNSNTVSTEMSHGFYFGFGMSGGSEEVKVGFSTNLEYSHGKGRSETHASAVGASSTVTDIDGPSLIADGVPKSVVESYKFYWTFGQWEDHLCGEDGQKTVFVGYGIDNIVSPAISVANLEAKATDIDKIKLSWSPSDSLGNWPDETGYYVYAVEDGNYRRISERLSKDTNEYTVTGLDSNTEYEFVITSLSTVDDIDKESVWSNVASCTTLKDNFKVNFVISNPEAIDFSANHMGNIEINDGDMVLEGNTVNLAANLTDERYALLSITVSTKDGVQKTIYPDNDGKSAEGLFVIEDDTTVTVSVERRVNSSEVKFEGNSAYGKVTAKVNGNDFPAPGGTVSSDVEFTATANSGYEFIQWEITDKDGKTLIVDAAGKNPYTLILTSEYHYVKAIFAQEAKYLITTSGEYTYTGEAIEPEDIVISANDTELSASDYDLVFENNINAGTAKVTATFKNSYKGSAETTFEIKPAELRINVAVNDKPYDGNNSATIKYAELVGVIGDDVVVLENGTPTFKYSDIATDIPVIFTDFTISGADAENYYLVQPAGITASIFSNYSTVKINIDNPDAVDFSAIHLGNVEISDGDNVVNGDVVTLSACVINASYSLIQIKVKDSDGEEKAFYPDASGNIEGIIAINSDIEITVESKRKVDESYVEFSDDENGSVSATVNGIDVSAPGATVSSNVIFTAIADDGYALKAWEITNAEGQTISVDAADNNPYTLVLTSSKHIVKAIFVPEEEATVNVKINYLNYGGKVLIEKKNGETVECDATNTVSVPLNTVLEFTAQPAYGCSFRNWADDAAGQSESTFEMQVTKDTVIGINFNISVQYKLNYGLATGEGVISVNPSVATGENLPVNTEATFIANAKDGFFVDKWVVTQGKNTETIYSDTVDATSDSLTVILSGETDVQVYFVPEIDYEITFGSEYIYSGKEIEPDDISISANGAEVKRSNYELAFENNINVGKANVNITFKNDYSGRAKASFEIKPAELTVDVKVEDKQYDGLNTATVKSAELDGIKGDDEVVLENGVPTFETVAAGKNIAVSFTDFAISGADAGNYILTQPSGVTADIFNKYNADKDEDYTVNSEDWINEDFVIEAAENRELSFTDSLDGEWSDKLVCTEETGNGKIEFYVRNTETGAISKVTEESYKIDKTNPQGKVTVGDNLWREFLNSITFELFFKDTQTVKIEAEDNQSGIASIGYYRSSEKLSQAKIASLSDVDWTEGDSVNITPDECNRFIFYIRVVDVAGNITYISTDGAEFDTTAPVITGITQNATYYTEQTAIASDKNLASVTVNGADSANPSVLKGNVAVVYTVTAIDKAGNATSVTVTMKPISSLAEKIAHLTEENVTSDDIETIEKVRETVNSLDVKSEDEIKAVNEINDRCDKLVAATYKANGEIDALKAEIDSYDIHKINIFQKEALENLLSRVEDALNDGNMGKAEKERLEEIKDQVEDMLFTVTCLADYFICPTRIIFTIVDFFKWIFDGIKNIFSSIC